MKHFILSIIIAATLVSCSPGKDLEGSPVGLVNLDGYSRIKNKDEQFHVITSDKELRALFMDDSGERKKPDFEGQLAIAISVEHQSLHFTKATIAGRDLNVYYEVGYGSPVSVATVPKNQSVRRVNFYQDNYLVRTIEVETR